MWSRFSKHGMSKLSILIKQFSKALGRFEMVLNATMDHEIVRDSAIQRFEFTLDLAWKAVKAYLEEEKGILCYSPKECFREAFHQGMIEDYDVFWLSMVDLRNQTVHTYDEELAERVFVQLPGTISYFKQLLGALQQTHSSGRHD